MKAVVYTQYGPPEVLQLKEVPKPTPKENEVLIKIRAATVNRTDIGFRKPDPFIVRFFQGLLKPKRTILGSEFSGVVEAAGKNVKSFKPGDMVFGLSAANFGTHAEYVCLPEDAAFTIKPFNMSFEETAAVCDGLMLANTYFKKMNMQRGQSILINGATGSIGTAAVQLAKYFGAEITAVCNTKNLGLVKSLGAGELIDYTKEDFTKINKQFDFVFDAVGKSYFFSCRNIIKKGGAFLSTDFGPFPGNPFLALWTKIFGALPCGKKIFFPLPKESKKDIIFFKELIESGNYKAVIDRSWPLGQIIDAYKYVETGEKTGNVVITVS